MYRLFIQPSKPSRGLLSLPRFTYVKQGVMRNASRLVAYARANPDTVRSDHILVQILQSLAVSITRDTEEYYRIVSELASELSQAVGLTTGNSYGKIRRSSDFYGKYYSEILLGIENDNVDLTDPDADWENWQPVKVLHHNVTSYQPEMLDGSDNSRDGLAVIQIDIPMLAMQYRAFRLREMQRPAEETQLTLGQFVMMYPITNMIWSHLDYSSFNFFLAASRGESYDQFRQRNSFYTTNYDEKAMDCYHTAMDAFRRREYTWQDFFKQIPAISWDNQWEVLSLPTVPATRQLEWALIYSRLPAVLCYFQTNEAHGIGAARQESRRVLRSLRQIRNDNSLKTQLPRDLYEEFSDNVLTLQDIL